MLAALWRPLRQQALLNARRSFHRPTSYSRTHLSGFCLTSLAAGAVVGFLLPVVLRSEDRTVHFDLAHVPVQDAIIASPQKPVQVDPDTSVEFPTTLIIPSKARLPPFTLLGVGVRRVSFLGVKVYSVAFYADLSNPALNIPVDATPDEKIEHIINNTACVLRIVPTRSTSYGHLRDGFMRALQARQRICQQNGTLSEVEALKAQSPLRKFKSMFPNTPLSKGTPLDILLTAPSKDPNQPRIMIARDLGSIDSTWVSQQFFLAYFEGDGISPPMKKSVVDMLQSLSGRT